MAVFARLNVGGNAPYSATSIPVAGEVISIILSMITIAALATCLSKTAAPNLVIGRLS